MGVKVIVFANVLKLHVFYSVLVHSRRSGRGKNFNVSIFLKVLHYGISDYVMMFVFLMTMAKQQRHHVLSRWLAILRTNSTNHTWVFGCQNRVSMLHYLKHDTSRQWNYGCMFPGSPCCTWTMTNGNALYCILRLLVGMLLCVSWGTVFMPIQ